VGEDVVGVALMMALMDGGGVGILALCTYCSVLDGLC